MEERRGHERKNKGRDDGCVWRGTRTGSWKKQRWAAHSEGHKGVHGRYGECGQGEWPPPPPSTFYYLLFGGRRSCWRRRQITCCNADLQLSCRSYPTLLKFSLQHWKYRANLCTNAPLFLSFSSHSEINGLQSLRRAPVEEDRHHLGITVAWAACEPTPTLFLLYLKRKV